VVLQVLKDNGEPVRAGDLLVRLDDTAIRESLGSRPRRPCAPPRQALEQAERQVQRLKTLQAQGMTLDAGAGRRRGAPQQRARATWWPRARAWSRRASSCAAPRCGRPLPAW
jgi:membrane fusion protein, multidrug efflux system